MTVARIRESSGADHVEVTFLESARFYLLMKSHPDFGAMLSHLKEAEAGGRSLAVQLPSIDSDRIESVSAP